MQLKYPKSILFLIVFCLIGAGVFYLSGTWKRNESLEKDNNQIAKNLRLLTSHASPQAGDEWVVSFETKDTADLTIIPKDQDTASDLDFISLTCDGVDKTEAIQTLEGGVIFFPGWQCTGRGELIHLVSIARKHTLEFKFGGEIAYAYNNPDSVSDTFSDTSKIATSSNITVTGGQVKLTACSDNGTACSVAGECCSGNCVDGYCCNSACNDQPTCQTCGIYSSNGAGTCGWVTAGNDPDNECATSPPPNANSCKSPNCSGSGYTCDYLAAGEQGQPACKRCNGSSYDPVNVDASNPGNLGDSEGTNKCDGDSGTCYRCLNGSCTYQASTQDLFTECSAKNYCTTRLNEHLATTCIAYCGTSVKNTGNCSGNNYSCASDVACGCASVGTDTSGTNEQCYTYDAKSGCYQWNCSCSYSTANNSYTCSGHGATWTYCKCN